MSETKRRNTGANTNKTKIDKKTNSQIGGRSSHTESGNSKYGKSNRTESGKSEFRKTNRQESGKPEFGKNSRIESEKFEFQKTNRAASRKSEFGKSNQMESGKPEFRKGSKSGSGKPEFEKSSRPEFQKSNSNHPRPGVVPARKKKLPDDGSCPYAKQCGACDYQGMIYEKQLTIKQTMVRKLMEPYCKTNHIIGMKDPYHYRHKVHATFDCTSRGQIICGNYKEGTHEVVDIDSCQIEDQKADAIIQDIKGLLRSFKIKTYDEDSGYGLLRHVMIRKGYHSKEIMVVLVLGSPILPSKNNFVKAIRKLHPEISTVVINVNNRKTSMVLGDRNITIYGKGFIEDQLCGCTFRISPNSFYQVNPEQTEILYSKAIEAAGLTGNETVIDAYCGTGTIGIIASGQAKNVIGVELNKAAVRDAITNAKRNEIKNAVFHNEDAGEFMVRMAEQGEKADVVIMDPPRAGSDEAFLSSVVKLAPKKVVYVSCNPETLARDVKYLVKHGYEALECTPVDLFPMTEHVETVCLMSRVKE